MIHLLICKRTLLPLASSPGGGEHKGKAGQPRNPDQEEEEI